MRAAIQTGDAESLRRLLTADASRANALIRWGRNECILTHPLHYVSDMLFEGTLKRRMELPLVEALIQAGADLDFQREREDGRKSDTPLIGAASLGAEEVGLRLLEAGARPELRRARKRPMTWRGSKQKERDEQDRQREASGLPISRNRSSALTLPAARASGLPISGDESLAPPAPGQVGFGSIRLERSGSAPVGRVSAQAVSTALASWTGFAGPRSAS